MNRYGIVLAGGFATRFEEGDKTLADLDGKPLIAHAVDALRPVVDAIVISCRSEQVQDFEGVLEGVVYRPDPTSDEGPLAGLDAALAEVEGGTVAVTTADRPCVPTSLYAEFFDALDRDGVVIESEGIVQPVPGVYDAEVLTRIVRERRVIDDRRLRSILDEMDLDTVSGERARERWGANVLTDVNATADLARLRNG